MIVASEGSAYGERSLVEASWGEDVSALLKNCMDCPLPTLSSLSQIKKGR